MRPRTLLFTTMLAFCHLILQAQALTSATPPLPGANPARRGAVAAGPKTLPGGGAASLPDDPDQEILPVARPEPEPANSVPVEWEAQNQFRIGDTWTLTGGVVVHYRDYILRADRVVYHQSTTDLVAEGNLELTGGPNDIRIHASNGEMRLNAHTARFFNVHGSQGIRTLGRTTVYSTTNPLLFSGRVLIETGEGRYKIIDGAITNCLLPHPDWEVIAHSIQMARGQASTSNAFFKLLGVPIFYLPYLHHPVSETGRESGFLIPVLSTSSIQGYTLGEQFYWAISRNMDMVAGLEYYSKRGWAPNGDFRYRGRGLDHLTVRWNALLDRGFTEQPGNEPVPSCGPTPTVSELLAPEFVNQGGVDITALGRKDLSAETRLASNVEYLSCYVYRLVFNDIYSLAVNSEVQSDIALTHAHRGFVPSVSLNRFETFASTVDGQEAKILHLPNLRYDVLDQPLGSSPFTWGMGSSLGYLGRAEPDFHARNVGRIDFYPHLSLPFMAGGWSVVPQAALRVTGYTISQKPYQPGSGSDLPPGTPTISHESLRRTDFDASVDIRPPAIERDFILAGWNREMRHVIEPEITYRYVSGIGAEARNVLLIDTTDIATNTNEVGYSLTQRFYFRRLRSTSCAEGKTAAPSGCASQTDKKNGQNQPREWASWQVAQKYYFDSTFGGALMTDRRNVFDSTLDLSGVAFLTSPRNLSPVISRLRFEAIHNLRIQWDLDYDPKAGRMDADNIYAGYSRGRTTVGVVHALLNAVDGNGSAVTITQSQQLQPFLVYGKPSGAGFNLAANTGYDFAQGQLQYAAVQAVYNWNCCGLSIGYRRFELGLVRNETQYLYSLTLANFGSVGDIRHANSAFPDPSQPPVY
ncbi:MAG: LPS-assembly protein LptD [Terracidiphilus sp.]